MNVREITAQAEAENAENQPKTNMTSDELIRIADSVEFYRDEFTDDHLTGLVTKIREAADALEKCARERDCFKSLLEEGVDEYKDLESRDEASRRVIKILLRANQALADQANEAEDVLGVALNVLSDLLDEHMEWEALLSDYDVSHTTTSLAKAFLDRQDVKKFRKSQDKNYVP